MKIALCLSGHLRKFEETYPSLKTYILDKYDCDIFISTWDQMGYSCAFKTDANLNSTSLRLSEVENLFKPKKIVVESSSFVQELMTQGDQYAPHLIGQPKHVGHMASMFYKIFAANEIRKRYQLDSGIQYDWIIRSRPDLIFHAPVIMPLDKNPGRVYVSKHQCSPGWLNDQFAIGQPEDIDLYSSLFFDLPEYFMARNEFYPEKYMAWGLNKKNLHAEMHDLQFHIHR